MLLPFQWAVIKVEDAKLLMAFIEKTTSTPACSKNFEKMEKAGVRNIYNQLREFVEMSEHYDSELKMFDASDFARRD